MAAKEAGQADPVGATPLHREGMHRAQCSGPCQELGVALVGGVDQKWFAQQGSDAAASESNAITRPGSPAAQLAVAMQARQGTA